MSVSIRMINPFLARGYMDIITNWLCFFKLHYFRHRLTLIYTVIHFVIPANAGIQTQYAEHSTQYE